MVDIIGWMGSIIYLTGDILLARKKTIGWILRIVGAAVWIYVGIETGLTSIIGIEFFAFCAAIYGIYKWRKKGEKNE